MKKTLGSLVVLVTLVLVACGPSKDELAKQEAARVEAAKTEAQEMFTLLRSDEVTGHTAMQTANKLAMTLRDAGLGLDAVGTSEHEIEKYVAAAYTRDTSKALNDLRNTHSNAAQARDLKAAVLESARWAGKSLGDFRTSEALLNQSIQRNLLEEAQAQGGPLTPAMYKAAGIPVPRVVIVKRVPQLVRKVAPARKPNTIRAARR